MDKAEEIILFLQRNFPHVRGILLNEDGEIEREVNLVEVLEAYAKSQEGKWIRVDGGKLPRKLTAENGAKGLLSGEFCEVLEDDDDPGNPFVVPVRWTTIKDIYKMIVNHYAPEPPKTKDNE